MHSEKKRLESMSELFESEKAYVKDMEIWCHEFRRFFLNCTSISPQRRFSLNNIIFLNSESIAILHKKIVFDMATKNEACRVKALGIKSDDIYQRMNLKQVETGANVVYKDLEYSDIYEKYVENFEIYKFYIERLPKVEFILDKELATNRAFALELKAYLRSSGYVVMGYKHFIFRPTQKLARYPLLLSAIAKNTVNDEVKDRIFRINSNLQEKTKRYDKVLGEVNNAFTVYTLLLTLEYKDFVQKKISLGLFLKDRRLLQISNDVYIKSKYRSEPKAYRVYLLDHMVLVVDVVVKKFGEALYIVDDPMPLIKYSVLDNFEDNVGNAYFKDKFKFKLCEIDGDNEIVMYFKTETQCVELINEINKTRQGLIDKFMPEIDLLKYLKLAEIPCDEVVGNDPYFAGNSFSEFEENRIKKLFIDTENRLIEYAGDKSDDKSPEHGQNDSDQQSNEFNEVNEKNLCDLIKFGRNKSTFERLYKNPSDIYKEFLLYTYPGGVILKVGEYERQVFAKNIRNLQYISEYNMVCYLMDDVCYWSHFDPDIILIDTNVVCKNADSYWYGKTLKTSYIIVRMTTASNSSYLHLYKVSNEKNALNLTLITQLYIGATITQLSFFENKLIACSLEFEVVDMFTLNTHSLINPTDLTLEYFLKFEPPSTARDVIKVKKGLYLVCSNQMGFFVNQFGSFANTPSFFGWYTKPLDFMIYNKFLIVISERNCVVYNIYTGAILAYIVKPYLKFVKCMSTPWLHDGEYLYELSLPKIKI